MRVYLRLISLLLLFPLPCLAQEEMVLSDSVEVDTVVTDSAEIRQYDLLLEVGPHQLSGIFMVQMKSPTEIIGTVINEFGLTAFDFVYNGKKTKLSNLPPFLDKWYIRKGLQADMSFFFSHLLDHKNATKISRQITFSPDGEISLINFRFKIHYTFTPIKDEI